jgi:hypothetical protein
MFPFLISHFYLHKSSNHTFINSQRLKSDHREDKERMRREYEYKIATMQSRIAVVERYHGGNGERLSDRIDREQERQRKRGDVEKAREGETREREGDWRRGSDSRGCGG